MNVNGLHKKADLSMCTLLIYKKQKNMNHGSPLFPTICAQCKLKIVYKD